MQPVVMLCYKSYMFLKGKLNLRYDSYLGRREELDNAAHGITVGHLLLYLVYCVYYGGLSVEHQTVGIGNVTNDLFGEARRPEQRFIDTAVLHWVVGGYDKRRYIAAYAHTTRYH